MGEFRERLYADAADAVRRYWDTRLRQHDRQGGEAGKKDQGNRAAVTGGAQLDGFIALFRRLLRECGLTDAEVLSGRRETTLPGYFRPTKDWDLVALARGRLIATIEVKSHAGPSYGNNFNNRVEEALGSATDFWSAYRRGVFKPSSRPFLGYLMLLEEDEKSMRKTTFPPRLYPVRGEFQGTSYADRYRLFCRELMRERLYDSTCFLLSNRSEGVDGAFSEPDPELSLESFAIELTAKAMAFAKQSQ